MSGSVSIHQQQMKIWEAITSTDLSKVHLLMNEATEDIFITLNPHWHHFGSLNLLMKLAREGLSHILLITMALVHPSSFDIPNENGVTALMLAAVHNRLSCIELLIDGGTTLDLQDDEGRTALMYAVICDRLEVAQLLMSRGALVDLTDIEDVTALMSSVKEGKLQCARLLLKNGAAADLQNSGGISSLMFAVMFNRPEVAQLLVDEGASPLLQNYRGRTALDIAREKEHHEIVSILTKELTWLSRRGFLMFLATQSYLHPAPSTPTLADSISRDELNVYYQKRYNPETRPNTAVHSVFFMEELQRYIISFLGPDTCC